MPGVEMDKHTLLIKEVTGLTRRYPSLLTSDLIARLEMLVTSSSRTAAVQELRNEYNLARVDQGRSLEKLAIVEKNKREEVSYFWISLLDTAFHIGQCVF